MFTSRRISTDDLPTLKRDVEASMIAIEQEFQTQKQHVPTEYTVEEPNNVAPFQTVLVSSQYNWTGITITGLAGVFMWYVEPIPPQMLDNPNVDNNGQWCKVYELTGTALL